MINILKTLIEAPKRSGTIPQVGRDNCFKLYQNSRKLKC